MDKRIGNDYQPDYTVSPGEVLSEELDALGMSQQELASRTGLTPKHIVSIAKARSPITPETAIKFERALGLAAEFWLNLESRYQEVLARLKDEESLEHDLPWLDSFPVAEMVRLGWIKKHKNSKGMLIEILRFFGVAGASQWNDVWTPLKDVKRSKFRGSNDYGAISAWLRRGEIVAAGMECSHFNRHVFRNSITKIRSATASGPNVFLSAMRELSAVSGVAVVFLPELPKAKINGAAYWLRSNKALICLSFRHETDDKIWMAFLQEAGHLLLHGKKRLSLDDDLECWSDNKTTDAKNFAEQEAIPGREFVAFVSVGDFTKQAICTFAKEISIAPGVVVNQLQTRGLISRAKLNDLKKPLMWGVAESVT
jgi:HTH-type transcriptional regulator/antitoxin HigA